MKRGFNLSRRSFGKLAAGGFAGAVIGMPADRARADRNHLSSCPTRPATGCPTGWPSAKAISARKA